MQGALDKLRGALKRPDLLRHAAYIDGEWVGGASGLEVINPATGETIGSIPVMGQADAERAVEAAHRALPEWRALSAKQRSAIVHRWFTLIRDNAEDLAIILTTEQGKPLVEARGEILYAASFVEWFAEEAKRVYGETIPGHLPDKRLFAARQPVGVVAAITPWNFPAAMITRKAGPALAVGCTMVLKPSELTPYSANALAFLAEEAGVPAGVFNVLAGDAPAIGDVLTSDPRVHKFTFTGSTAVGKMLGAKCMSTVKRLSLELGGNAPLIVFDDADLEEAVQGALASKFRNAGQTCVCANRLLVQNGIHDAFVARLTEVVAAMKLGNGLEDDVTQGPLIDERAREKVQRHIADALEKGGQLHTGGAAVEGAGTFFQPTVISGVHPDALLCREETFGPVAGIVRFSNESEAVRMANDTSAGLAAYLFTRDINRAVRVGEALEYGMVGLNTGLISSEMAPFGGVKESGLGREGSLHGIDDYLEIKTLCLHVSSDAA